MQAHVGDKGDLITPIENVESGKAQVQSDSVSTIGPFCQRLEQQQSHSHEYSMLSGQRIEDLTQVDDEHHTNSLERLGCDGQVWNGHANVGVGAS